MTSIKDYSCTSQVDKINSRLQRAVERGLASSVQKSIAEGADVNCHFDGRYLIQHAAEFGKTEVLKTLLNNGADPNSQMALTKTALTSSCELGIHDSAIALLAAGADPNSDRGSPLIASCAIRDSDNVDALIKAGASPNLGGLLLDSSPLEVICTLSEDWRQSLKSNPKWYMQVINVERKYYLQKGSEKLKKREIEQVHQEFLDAGMRIALSLINAGADPNYKLPMGNLPLVSAIESENMGVFMLLLCQGADIDLKVEGAPSPKECIEQKKLSHFLLIAKSIRSG